MRISKLLVGGLVVALLSFSLTTAVLARPADVGESGNLSLVDRLWAWAGHWIMGLSEGIGEDRRAAPSNGGPEVDPNGIASGKVPSGLPGDSNSEQGPHHDPDGSHSETGPHIDPDGSHSEQGPHQHPNG
ncbi:MAG: hypothetical protein AAF481_11240 [Acidobacteriota bacterium]